MLEADEVGECKARSAKQYAKKTLKPLKTIPILSLKLPRH